MFLYSSHCRHTVINTIFQRNGWKLAHQHRIMSSCSLLFLPFCCSRYCLCFFVHMISSMYDNIYFYFVEFGLCGCRTVDATLHVVYDRNHDSRRSASRSTTVLAGQILPFSFYTVSQKLYIFSIFNRYTLYTYHFVNIYTVSKFIEILLL